MTRVLYIILTLEIGGMEQVVSNLVLNLDKSCFEPVVICVNALGPIAEELRENGITVIRAGKMIPVLSFLFPLQLIKLIRKIEPNVIHVHSGCWHKAAMAGFLAGVKRIIYTEHGRKGYFMAPDRRTSVFLDRLFSIITSHVVCVSQELADVMVRSVGIPKNKVSCIINGIDEQQFLPARRPQKDIADRLGIVARLVPVKDIATLLNALYLLRSRGDNVTLTVAGDGRERGMLENLALSLGIGHSVDFLGFTRDITTVLTDIDIFVLSSLSEGTSITLLEAMAAGKPVVVTNVGGNPEIVKDGINGLLVPPSDPAALADALFRLIMDKELRNSMSAANINAIRERYNIRSMTESYQILYGGS